MGRYGFVPILSMSPLQNASLIKNNNVQILPNNLAFHDLRHQKTGSVNYRLLLGMGKNFIPTPRYTTSINDIEPQLEQFERLVKLRVFYAGEENDEPLSKLRLNSKWVPPSGFIPREVLRRLAAFRQSLKTLFKRRKGIPNLNPAQRYILWKLQRERSPLSIVTDKNCGLGTIEREPYVKDMFVHHLNDQSTYKPLSKEEAYEDIYLLKAKLEEWIEEYKVSLGTDVVRYLKYHLGKCKDYFSFAYQLYKIHKTQLTTRAIMSGSGSLLHNLGYWITEQLRPVTLSMPTVLKSSYDLKEKIVSLNLPPNARCFTCDCKKLYPSIKTKAVLDVIEDYLHDTNNMFDYDADALVDALRLLMENLYFRFGDVYYKQISGSAMGVPPAPDYANIFYGIHELAFLPEFEEFLAAYHRFIDDIFGIWIPHSDPAIDKDRWNCFKATVNGYYDLEWVFVERSKQVDFMDLTITITDGKISTNTFRPLLLIHQEWQEA